MFSIHALLSLLATTLTFGIGIFVFFKSSRSNLSQVFFLLSIALGILALSQFQMRIATNFNDAFLWSKIYAIWPIALALSAHFVLSLNQEKSRSFLFYLLLYLPGIIISYLQLTTNLIALNPAEKSWGWVMIYSYGTVYNIAVSYWVIYWAITLIVPFFHYKKSKGNFKKQAFLIFIGYAIDLIITFISDILSKYFTSDIPEFGIAADVIPIIFIGYGMWKYDLFSLSGDTLSKKLFTSISDYLFLIDENKRIVEINSNLLEKLEYAKEEVAGKKLNVILDYETMDTNPIQSFIYQLSDFQNKPIIFKSKGNDAVVLNFSASTVKLGPGLNRGKLYFGKELTKNRITAQELKDNAKQIDFLSHAAIDLMQKNNKEKVYEYITDKIYNLLEKKAIVICSEFKGDFNNNEWEIHDIKGINKRLQDLNRILGFDFSKMKASSNKKYLGSIKEGKLVPFEFDIENLTNGFISKEKGEIAKKFLGLKEMHVISVSKGNEVFGTITIISNKNTPPLNAELIESFMAMASMELKKQYVNSELQKTENLFKTIIENSQIHIFLVDRYGKLLLAEGKHLYKKTGIKGSKIIGKSIPEIFPNVPVFQQQMKRAMKGEAFSDIITLKSKYFFNVIYTPFINENKEFAGFLAMAMDITERIDFENKLSDLSDLQARLISIIAHDLNSPIANILGLSEILIEDYESKINKEALDLIKMINKSGKNGHEILKSMLAWYYSLKEGVALTPEHLSLNELIVTAIKQVTPQAELKNITIQNSVHDSSHIFADREMVLIVFRNLLTNAIKFSHPKDTVKIYDDVSDDHVNIFIADPGVGMPEELKNLILNFKMDKNTRTLGTAGEKGTGLGLQICTNLIEKNKGKIEIESKLGEGSIFKIQLPKSQGI